MLVIESGKLTSIITEREYSRKMHLLDKLPINILIKEIMVNQVAYVNPDYTTEALHAIRVRHLPVLENDQVIGIISIGDLVKDAISDREFVISQLELIHIWNSMMTIFTFSRGWAKIVRL